ncbi:penicillin-insensitive murein endopeptidase [Oceanimonas sp. NS1]|nr:penicillin-insensitive murein endopeptidase [Oceanimonas sp. NS1]
MESYGQRTALPHDQSRLPDNSAAPAPCGTGRGHWRHAAGCQTNARALPVAGVGYRVVRAERQRYYGQAQLIDYLQALGKRAQQAGLPPMLVADIARRHGGPFAYGHRSHQTGLDADIWLRPETGPCRHALGIWWITSCIFLTAILVIISAS